MTSPDPAVEALIADGTWSALPLGPSASPRTHRSRVAEGLVRLVREADAAEPVRTTDPVRAALVGLMSEARSYLEPLDRPDTNPAMAKARAALAADREPEPPTVPMLRDGNGWVDPYMKLRQRDAELEELCDEIDRLKAEPVRAAAEALVKALQRARYSSDPTVALSFVPGRARVYEAMGSLIAALAADHKPEPVQVTDEMARKVLVQLLMRSPNGLTEASVKEALAAALSDPPPEGESD